jgi:cell division septum initiation protein DivIVA
VIPEPAKTFARTFWGYNTDAVDAHIEVLTTKQQLLLDDVESLMNRLRESGAEVAELRRQVAVLSDTSPSSHAMQQRLAQMLRRAVDEISEMHAEARVEADELIRSAEAEAEAMRQKHEESLADMAAQLETLESDHAKTKNELDAKLTSMRAETQSAIDEALQDAEEKREQLLADAKQEADHYREQAMRAADEASQHRIKTLERLMGIYRDLEAVPASLESALQEVKNPGEESSDSTDTAPINPR